MISANMIKELKEISPDIENDSKTEIFISDILPVEDPIQIRIFFENGYGASIIRHSGSYGSENKLFELAVIEHQTVNEKRVWNLTYDTKITDDVIGSLTGNEVLDIVSQIKNI